MQKASKRGLAVRSLRSRESVLRISSGRMRGALLKYNATVYGGIPIFERDRSERNLFELKVEQEWDDEEYYLKRDQSIVLNRLFTDPIR